MSPTSNPEAFELNSISTIFNEKTLVAILKKALNKDDCVLARWEVAGGAGAKGDSYLSEVVRMKVQAQCSSEEVEKSSVYLVIKSLPSNIGRRKTFRSTDFFRNEIAFYQHVVPAFEALEKRKNVSYNLFAKCYALHCDGEHDFIALEDLSRDGYYSASRQDGMNSEQCEDVMQSLAKFHGLSYALKDQDPKTYSHIVGTLEETYFDVRFSEWIRDFHEDQIACALDALEKEYPDSIYLEKMKNFIKEDFYEKMIGMLRDKDRYSVINHGDSWVPNLLLNHSLSRKVKLIDFQLVREASPVMDVVFFFYSGTTRELRDEHFDKLIKIYYSNLQKTITELGSNSEDLIQESDLHDQLRKFGKFGLGFSMESVPFSVMENEDTPDLDTIQGEDPVPLTNIWKVRPITHQKGRLRLADNVRHAVDNGFL